jgi:hypothetical protein
MSLLFQPMALHLDLAFLIVLKYQHYCTMARIGNRQRNDLFIDLINGNAIDVVFKRFTLIRCGAVENADDLWTLNVPLELTEYAMQRIMESSGAKLN